MIEINKIYNEDNIETLKKMDSSSLDMVITSPPYDELRDYKGFSFDLHGIIDELLRCLKDGAVVIWNVNDATKDGSETGTSFKQALLFIEKGFNLHDTMIWNKSNPLPVGLNHKRYTSSFEYMFVFSKGRVKTFNPLKEKALYSGKKSKKTFQREKDGTKKHKVQQTILDEKIISNVWLLPTAYEKESYIHPAPFPTELVIKHIKSWTNENDLIYDPFMGSGTTAKAAHLLNRNWIGSEISKEYCELSNKRLDTYMNQTRLF